ncbi:MAG: sigma-70 family RNA polymerase sigma factor [Gemmataceae bacterium]
MASGATSVLRRAVAAAAKAEARDLTDRDLLQRFAFDGDQSAFALLVARHTGMVYSVCRRGVHSAQDAEDACQATFLVLTKKAKAGRWQASVANWLYTTARKTAANARIAAVRRAKREAGVAVPERVEPVDTMTGRELLAALDDELEKLSPAYREPLVLCYLEGLSREDAALRLGVPAGTVKIRLERGRKKLGDALTRRGVVGGVGILALAVTSPAGASPLRIVEAVLDAAAGHASPAVVALAEGVAVNGLLNKSLWVAALVGVATLGAGTGILRSPAGQPPTKAMPAKVAKADDAPPRAAAGDTKAVTGRVFGADGQPAAGVTVWLAKQEASRTSTLTEVARTDAQGTFAGRIPAVPAGRPDFRSLVVKAAGAVADWYPLRDAADDAPATLRLLPDDTTIRGRVVGLEGKPIAAATVKVTHVETTADGDLAGVFGRWSENPYFAINSAAKKVYDPTVVGLPPTVTADADGRFAIRGVGRGRLVALRIEGPGIEVSVLRVVTTPGFDPASVKRTPRREMPDGMSRAAPDLYGPEFTHSAKPDQPITGVVRDKTTGKPVAGIMVSANVRGSWYEKGVQTTTDADGKYTLRGIGKGAERQVMFYPSAGSPYLPANRMVADAPGLATLDVDHDMTRGVVVTGKVVDKATGQPVVGASVKYVPLAGNKAAEALKGSNAAAAQGHEGVMPDGTFKLTVLPGPGLITAENSSERGSDYAPVRLRPADKKYAYVQPNESLGESFSAYDGHIEPLFTVADYAVIDPATDATEQTVELTFDPGRTVAGTLADAAGRPVEGATAYGRRPRFDKPTALASARFEASALVAERPRAVVFVHPGLKLTGVAKLAGTETDVTVMMEPWGTLTGRVVDADGKPVADVTIGLTVQRASMDSGLCRGVEERRRRRPTRRAGSAPTCGCRARNSTCSWRTRAGGSAAGQSPAACRSRAGRQRQSSRGRCRLTSESRRLRFP